MIGRLLPVLAALALLAAAPSVLVRTEAPRLGRLPILAVGYGTARPTPDGTASLAVQHAGIVARLAIVPGQRVAAGEALAVIAATPAVRAQYRQAGASLALARAERAHVAELRAERLATASQLAAADKAMTDATAALDALAREGAGAPRQVLRAPFAGIVTAVGVSQGEAVAAGAKLFQLARDGAFLVAIGLPPAVAASVRPGQPARITALAGGPDFAGIVRGVGGMVDPATHLVAVTLAPAGGDPPLPGASFRAAIRVGWYRGWIVPRDAVMSGADGDVVYQVAAGHAVRVKIRVVGAAGGETAIAGPVAPGRKLVTEGAYQLAPGMDVRLAPARAR